MKKLRLQRLMGAVQDHRAGRGWTALPDAYGLSLLPTGNAWVWKLKGMTCCLGMYTWMLCSTVALKFLGKDVNLWVLLKPRECTRQCDEQAGRVRQSHGGSGGREDQPADGREEESGSAFIHSAAQVIQSSWGLDKRTRKQHHCYLRRPHMERKFPLFFS